MLGLTGAGGGSLAVPALVFGLGLTVPQAAPIALVAVAGSALLGTLEAFRARLVRYRAATLMATMGIMATPLGVWAAHRLPEPILLVLFAAVLGMVAIRTLRRTTEAAEESLMELCRIDPATGRLRWSSRVALIMSAIGATTGFLSGLLGVGGGFIMVPALRKASDIPLNGIVATSLMVMTLVSTSALIASLSQGVTIQNHIAIPFVTATAAGMMIGRYATRRLASVQIQRIFGLLLLLASLFLLLRGLSI